MGETKREKIVVWAGIIAISIVAFLTSYFKIFYGVDKLFTDLLYHTDSVTNSKIKLIAEKLKQGEKLSALIRKYSFSRRAFYYAWKKQFSVSPKEMENTARLEKAQDLLLHSSLPLSEIAGVCHFSSHRYFHECFLKHFSCTPGEYRKRFR